MMETFGEKLKAARLRKGLKQSEVAAVLDCAPTSLTNWENGKIQPSVEVVARLSEVYEISPLDLLGKQYSFIDIAAISNKPAYERSYEEELALNFSGMILETLLPAEKRRQETERIERTAQFVRGANLLERFGGTMNRKNIEAIMAEYETSGAADMDILFAFHALKSEYKATVLDVLRGLISVPGNIQPIAENMEAAASYTADSLEKQRQAFRCAVSQEMGE